MRADHIQASKAGFTLVEVMIASALLVIAGIALYGSAISASRMTAMAKDHAAAQGIAFDELWRQYNRPLADFEDITVATNWSFATDANSQFGEDAIVRIAIFPPTQEEDYWEIQSNLIWPGRAGTVTNGFSVRRYRTERF